MSTKVENKFGDLREIVKEALAEREEATRLDKIEALLEDAQTTINELTNTVADKEQEIASANEDKESLSAQIEELKTKMSEVEDKLASANKNTEEAAQRAVEAETALANIAADRRLEVRMAELTEAKVAKGGNKLEAQKERVRALSDEEFAAYKDDLIEFRAALEAEFKAAASDDDVDTENVVDVAPADIDNAKKDSAATGVLNVELVPDDMKTDYAAMGKEMAKLLKDAASLER